MEAFSERVVLGPIMVRELFVHYGDQRRVRAIRFQELAPAQDGHAPGGKVAVADVEVRNRDGLLLGWQRIAFRNETHASASEQRNTRYQGRRTDSRRAAGFVQKILVETAGLIVGVMHGPGVEASEIKMIDAEAWSLEQ